MMAITRNDVIKLLALAAGADQRTVADEDILMWHAIAQQQNWIPAAAQRVIIDHYSRGADRPRITPAAITDRLRALRNQAAESFEAPVIPADLPDSIYPAWYRGLLADHIDEQLERWATTGQEPDRGLPLTPANQTLAELIDHAPEHLQLELRAGLRRAGRTPE